MSEPTDDEWQAESYKRGAYPTAAKPKPRAGIKLSVVVPKAIVPELQESAAKRDLTLDEYLRVAVTQYERLNALVFEAAETNAENCARLEKSRSAMRGALWELQRGADQL